MYNMWIEKFKYAINEENFAFEKIVHLATANL